MKVKSWAQRQFKKKPRIYIVPTRMGGYLNGLIFLMFLLSVGYGNNLLLIFTLFLFGFNMLWLIQTHFYLHRFKGPRITIEDSFAREDALILIQWDRSSEDSQGLEMNLETVDHSYLIKKGSCRFPSRGVWSFTHLKVSTELPYGLYRAWIYHPLQNVNAFVYPEKLKEVPPLDIKGEIDEGELAAQEKGLHDFWGLGPYEGEESRRISWKHYARSGALVIKEGEKFSSSKISFRYYPELPDKEVELSRLATQMLYCQKNEINFSLNTGTFKNEADRSQKHLKECLRELSKC